MRDIKFRGKDNHSTWRYGNLVCLEGNTSIYFPVGKGEVKSMDWVYVNPESVGQYTGLYDKNGKEIYEGDIIQRHKRKYVVRWCGDNYISFELQYNGNGPFGKSQGFADFLKADLADTYEVIGNIYDNPELVTNDF